MELNEESMIYLHLMSLILPRVSNDCLDHVYHSVMSQLSQEHAEVRLSAFQIATELFTRSHHFRMLLVDNFQVLALRRHVVHLRYFFMSCTKLHRLIVQH